MKNDCYLKDNASTLSDYVVIEKDDDFKKTQHIVKAAICKKCGYIELYVDLKENTANHKLAVFFIIFLY